MKQRLRCPSRILLNCICSVSDCRGATRLSVFEGDIRDGELVKRACRGASVVFHIASVIDVKESMEYSEMFAINVKGKFHDLHWETFFSLSLYVCLCHLFQNLKETHQIYQIDLFLSRYICYTLQH